MSNVETVLIRQGPHRFLWLARPHHFLRRFVGNLAIFLLLGQRPSQERAPVSAIRASS